jgi:acylphosphatase
MREIHAIVKGKVQGIGFRAKTKFFADALGLTGYVRNLSDGSVEICAQGSHEKLAILLEQVRKQFHSYIQDIQFVERTPKTPFMEFRVTLA